MRFIIFNIDCYLIFIAPNEIFGGRLVVIRKCYFIIFGLLRFIKLQKNINIKVIIRKLFCWFGFFNFYINDRIIHVKHSSDYHIPHRLKNFVINQWRQFFFFLRIGLVFQALQTAPFFIKLTDIIVICKFRKNAVDCFFDLLRKISIYFFAFNIL